jgi:membrane protein
MAGSTSGQREAMRREAAMRRERIAGALAAMREEFAPGAMAHRATRRMDWRDLRSASLVLGRTLRDNPVATVVATGSVLWLALRSRSVLERQPPRADLVLVPDRNGSDGAMPTPSDPLDTRATTDAGPRGHDAREPRQIPKRGWKKILSRVWTELGDDNISIVAAGVAFYALLAIFPALGAALAIYGFVADPADVSRQLASLGGMIPADARSVLEGQLSELASQPKSTLSIGAVVGILLALWSASSGIKTLMTALNIVYAEREKRAFLRYNLTALVMTLGAILAGLVAIALVAILPPIIEALRLPDWLHWLVSLARWPILALGTVTALAVLFRYGPSRTEARWNWVSWGAVAATLLWIVASALFSWYAANFANYNKTYGSVGAIVALLMWFYLTAYVVLLGAELNSEMERQTAKDTTRGPEKPMGDRGARMADTVAA